MPRALPADAAVLDSEPTALPLSTLLTTVLTLAACLLGAAPAAPQQEPAAQFRERIQVTEVLLDVLVTDRRGNVIVGLDKEDFIVEEGNQPVSLTAATFYGSRQILESPALASRLQASGSALPVDRYFILFFHDAHFILPQLRGQQMQAARLARRWVEEKLGDKDWVAVAGYNVKLRVYQDFTTNRDEILAALDEVQSGKAPSSTWPVKAQLGDAPSLMRHLPQGKALRKATTRIQDGLRLLAEAAGHTTGRKNLLFFSIGFGEINTFGTWDPDVRYYPRMMQTLNDSNVAVYTISLVERQIQEPPVVRALSGSLSKLASDTGGVYYSNFISFDTPLEQVTEENGGYYLLSYSAEYPAGNSGYREVRVRTTNPDFQVRARNGYQFGS